MTGAYFFHAIKTDRELRQAFEAWVKEQRSEYSRQLETAEANYPIFVAQGRIRALDTLLSLLDQALNLPADEPVLNGKS